ncbi:HNH endonuclease domain-containing protein [Lachnospira pectinoschiza]|uniref:HNH endonuclease n=1 Tax=Lachnospira pectinoschiza TaxID=28052 RepID=A0A1G9TIV0_9FIRM|nr:HNH endonuclease domain-containing protein [Lachnospira pectinoschiza]SDM47677.1 HNH endonuclease [Lachnospira pectinoschiza]
MAEFDFEKNGLKLNIDDDYFNRLDVEAFYQMLKNPSYCYKFYWLEACVKLISENVERTTFSEIIDEMIANAWYTVLEYHIHLSGVVLGEVRDGLERAVLLLKELSGLPSNASKVEIKNAIKAHEGEMKNVKIQLTKMVPYRALAGFFNRYEKNPNWESISKITIYIDEINQISALPYVLGTAKGLAKEVVFNSFWIKMIQDNTVAILSWIQYEKVKWLQNNNPEVPSLVYKLEPMDENVRKLSKVHKLWDAIMDVSPVIDVFKGSVIDESAYDVDHFIPWSFVMNDELWNLMPMDSALNSAKSNKLPKWDPFFTKFASNQYKMYELINDESKPEIRRLFEGCYRDNLHSIWAANELYRKGNSKEVFYGILEKNMQPVYDSAKRQGYQVWM